MHALAALGGTGSHRAVESGNQLAAALRQISQGGIDCRFQLQVEPGALNYLRVALDGHALPFNTADGWVISGNVITLQGSSCSTLRDGKKHELEVLLPCSAPGP